MSSSWQIKGVPLGHEFRRFFSLFCFGPLVAEYRHRVTLQALLLGNGKNAVAIRSHFVETVGDIFQSFIVRWRSFCTAFDSRYHREGRDYEQS